MVSKASNHSTLLTLLAIADTEHATDAQLCPHSALSLLRLIRQVDRSNESVFDGASRVPLLIAGPGIQAGSVTRPTSLVDLYPTILDLASIKHPTDLSYTLAGHSLVTDLTGNQLKALSTRRHTLRMD